MNCPIYTQRLNHSRVDKTNKTTTTMTTITTTTTTTTTTTKTIPKCFPQNNVGTLSIPLF